MLSNKQSPIITLYTTFPLKSFERFKPSLHSWISNIAGFAQFILVLDSNDSLIAYQAYPSDLRKFIEDNCLQLQSISDFEDAPQATSRNSGVAPSLRGLLQLMRTSETDLVGFFNADLILANNSGLSEYIVKIRSGLDKEIHFGHRMDCDNLFQNLSLYEQGYDYFITTSTFLKEIDSVRLSSERIGQVGWDYIFPLSILHQDVFLAPALDIFHVRHPTGSQQCWASFVIDSVAKIDKSWLSSKKVRLPMPTVRIIVKLYKCLVKALPLVSILASFLVSRIIFYCFMKPLLLSMQKKAG